MHNKALKLLPQLWPRLNVKMKNCVCMVLISLVLSVEAAELEPPTNPTLRQELLELMRVDQEIRSSNAVDPTEMASIDARNTARLKQIIAESGWPTKSMVGEDGASAAWLLAQHADRDIEFQRSVLSMIEKLLSTGEANPSNYAYLYDRIHRPQKYGTQGACTAPGKWEPREIEDPGHVDDRRASMSIYPTKLAQYVELVSKLCK